MSETSRRPAFTFFKARYKGKCHVCGDQIMIGAGVCYDTISPPFSNGRQPVIHVGCFEDVRHDGYSEAVYVPKVWGSQVCNTCWMEKSLTGACACD